VRQQKGRKDVSTAEHAETNRRDFLYIATGAVGAVGAALIRRTASGLGTETAVLVDLPGPKIRLQPIAEGQEITIKWRGNPVFIRHRLPAEIEAAKGVPMSELKDPLARNANVPEGDEATDANRVVGGKEQFLVMMGVCTHLGCVPIANEGDFAVVEGSAKHGGWFCPCHGSHYDTAGRIRKGPAPQNLPVPQYAYLSDTKIRIG